MAYKNVEVKCGGYEPLRVKDAYIQTFATSSTPNYDGEQYFDLTKPHDMITVGQSDTKTITFGSTIQISIDNTINTTYIQIFANGTRVDYHTLAQKRTEFYIVAVGDPDNQNGLGSVILETSSYNWCSRKCANSTVNAAIYELLNPSTWQNASINGINLGIDESNTYWKSQSSSDSIAQQSDFAGLTTNPVIPNNEFSTKFLIGDAQLGLRLYVSGSMCEWQPYKNGNAILPNLLSSPQPNNYYTMGVTLFIGYNDTIQEGQLMVKYYQDVGDPRYNQWTLKRSFTNYIEIYNWVKDMMNAFPIITHTWYSLTSISGNGLTIPLVKLASDAINDGDPVSDATTSAFDVLPSSDNNVRSLVNLTLEPISTDNAVTITYSIPALKDGSYSSVKVYAKIGEAPKCDETDDIVEDIDPTINEISLENLEFETEYFFCIQSISNNGLKLSSNVESITTGELEGTTFDFTGNEQTFVVPETGMYSLETWGAQGQSDENNRGGYGAYAYVEAFLTQGQTLYINVGGQNGYNGGGNYQHGTIRNILIPDSGQSFIIDERCWTQTGTTPSAVYPDSTLTCFALGSDMGKIRNEIGRDNYVVLWERNGIKCYVGITRTNASYGEPKFCCAIYNEKNERVLGSLDIRSTYSQEFGPYCGFDAATEDWYNSNVRARLYHWGLAYGVDDTNHLGYVVHCYGQHRGYYENTNLYLPQASYDSSYYGWNAAKLYDALIRASQ